MDIQNNNYEEIKDNEGKSLDNGEEYIEGGEEEYYNIEDGGEKGKENNLEGGEEEAQYNEEEIGEEGEYNIEQESEEEGKNKEDREDEIRNIDKNEQKLEVVYDDKQIEINQNNNISEGVNNINNIHTNKVVQQKIKSETDKYKNEEKSNLIIKKYLKK